MATALMQHHIVEPHNLGVLEGADAIGQEGMPGAGPFMTVYLKTHGECITQAYFTTYGCPIAIACGSWTCQWLEGCTISQASVLEAEDLARMLGGLPLGREHCAELVVKALRKALKQAPVQGRAGEETGRWK